MSEKAKKVENIVLKFSNSRRDSYGLDRADTDTALISAGREHARNMARNGYVGHRDPKGRMPEDRVEKYDIVCENCARIHGWSSSSAGSLAADLIDQWMTSKGHRENILRDRMNKMGVGVWKSKNKVYATQLLADAKTQSVTGLMASLFS